MSIHYGMGEGSGAGDMIGGGDSYSPACDGDGWKDNTGWAYGRGSGSYSHGYGRGKGTGDGEGTHYGTGTAANPEWEFS